MAHPIFAFGLPHGPEWLIILVLAILFFGADKLPKLARGLGKSLGEFKKAKEDFEKEVQSAATQPEAKKIEDGQPAAPISTASTTPTQAGSVDELTKKI